MPGGRIRQGMFASTVWCYTLFVGVFSGICSSRWQRVGSGAVGVRSLQKKKCGCMYVSYGQTVETNFHSIRQTGPHLRAVPACGGDNGLARITVDTPWIFSRDRPWAVWGSGRAEFFCNSAARSTDTVLQRIHWRVLCKVSAVCCARPRCGRPCAAAGPGTHSTDAKTNRAAGNGRACVAGKDDVISLC